MAPHFEQRIPGNILMLSGVCNKGMLNGLTHWKAQTVKETRCSQKSY
jgi:hypothetical protein